MVKYFQAPFVYVKNLKFGFCLLLFRRFQSSSFLCCFFAFVDIDKNAVMISAADRGIFTFFGNRSAAKNLGVVPLHSHLLKQAPKHYLTTPTLLPPRSTQSFGTPLHLSYKTYYKTHYKTYNNLLIIYPKILFQISFKFMIVYIYFSLKNIINYITFPQHHIPLNITCQTTNLSTQFQYNFNKKFIKKSNLIFNPKFIPNFAQNNP